MVCSLLGGRGGAQLVTEEPNLSRRSPALQSKMGERKLGRAERKRGKRRPAAPGAGTGRRQRRRSDGGGGQLANQRGGGGGDRAGQRLRSRIAIGSRYVRAANERRSAAARQRRAAWRRRRGSARQRGSDAGKTAAARAGRIGERRTSATRRDETRAEKLTSGARRTARRPIAGRRRRRARWRVVGRSDARFRRNRDDAMELSLKLLSIEELAAVAHMGRETESTLPICVCSRELARMLHIWGGRQRVLYPYVFRRACSFAQYFAHMCVPQSLLAPHIWGGDREDVYGFAVAERARQGVHIHLHWESLSLLAWGAYTSMMYRRCPVWCSYTSTLEVPRGLPCQSQSQSLLAWAWGVSRAFTNSGAGRSSCGLALAPVAVHLENGSLQADSEGSSEEVTDHKLLALATRGTCNCHQKRRQSQ
ncbi:hypothetical protein Scep_017140 [Stephania cephalantha]|uniref:Uncharacterized protein n=1 Tax=Stephania cephalantha TaxID=152367 RepID=A0AAP0NTA4_9MAGN